MTSRYEQMAARQRPTLTESARLYLDGEITEAFQVFEQVFGCYLHQWSVKEFERIMRVWAPIWAQEPEDV